MTRSRPVLTASLLLAAGVLLWRLAGRVPAPEAAAPPQSHAVGPPVSAPPADAPSRRAEPVPSRAPAKPRVELPWDLEEIAQRYREASSAEERADALLELGLSDDPLALEFLLGELERADASQREPIVRAVIQFGSRDAIPRLRALARATRDPDQRRRLEEAADYLALPSLTELRRGEVEPPAEDPP